jgi:hypothetical protein
MANAGSTIYRQLREVFAKALKSDINWSGRGRTGRRGKATIPKWRLGGTRLGDAFLKATALLFPTDRDQKAAEKSIHKFFVDSGKMRSMMVASESRGSQIDDDPSLYSDQEANLDMTVDAAE